MKRLIVAIILLGAVYYIGQMVVSGITTFTGGASLVLSGVNRNELQKIVIDHYNSEILTNEYLDESTQIDFQIADINADTLPDVIATAHETSVCGSGGCITTIFLQNDLRNFEPIEFKYAVKSIEVMNSITDDMHDLMINGDSKNILFWNGSEYGFNEI